MVTMTNPVGTSVDVDLTADVVAAIPDQGPRPTCAAWSVTGAHEALCAERPPEPLAPEALWRSCVQRGAAGAAGALLTDIGRSLAEDGQPPLAVWPYDASLGAGSQDPPSAAERARWRRAQLVEIALLHDGVEPALEAALGARRPVVIVLELTDSFFECRPDGELSVPSITAPTGGYHAVLVIGASTRLGTRYLRIKNTWGPAWGEGGCAWMPLGYLEAFVVQAFIVSEQI